MGWRNPFREMLGIVRELRQVPGQMVERCAAESLEMARQGFWLQQDPYGRPWEVTVTGKPFDQRAGLERAFVATRRTLGFFVECRHEAFKYHQNGTLRLPERLMVPTVTRGLGLWGERYRQIAAEVFSGAVQRGRAR